MYLLRKCFWNKQTQYKCTLSITLIMFYSEKLKNLVIIFYTLSRIQNDIVINNNNNNINYLMYKYFKYNFN